MASLKSISGGQILRLSNEAASCKIPFTTWSRIRVGARFSLYENGVTPGQNITIHPKIRFFMGLGSEVDGVPFSDQNPEHFLGVGFYEAVDSVLTWEATNNTWEATGSTSDLTVLCFRDNTWVSTATGFGNFAPFGLSGSRVVTMLLDISLVEFATFGRGYLFSKTQNDVNADPTTEEFYTLMQSGYGGASFTGYTLGTHIAFPSWAGGSAAADLTTYGNLDTFMIGWNRSDYQLEVHDAAYYVITP